MLAKPRPSPTKIIKILQRSKEEKNAKQKDVTLSIESIESLVDQILGGPSLATAPQKWLLFGGLWGDNDSIIRKSPRSPLNQASGEKWGMPTSWTNANTRETA